MKKALLFFAILFISALSLSAQNEQAAASDSASINKTCCEKPSKFSLQVGGGVNITADNFTTTDHLFGTTPAIDLALGFRPVQGLEFRLGYEGFTAKRLEEKFGWGLAHFDIMFGITELKKVREKCQHFVLRPYITAGAGFGAVTSFAYGVGGEIGYRINDKFEINLDGRGLRLTDGTVFPGGSGVCGNASVTLNFVFNF